MEKIVVLTRNDGDNNLVSCLKMLFPECVIEVHERELKGKAEKSFSAFRKNVAIDEGLNKSSILS
jgi:hypothetical protein